MIESVLKYRGFYVARYEAGLDKETGAIVFKNASIEENNTITTDASNLETNSWYGLYKKIKTFATSENEDDMVVSSMIWGSQYDAMMNWMAKTGNNVGTIDENNKNKEKITGKFENDKINNIYDLRGCHYEWTMEASGENLRGFRGGAFGPNYSPANRRNDYPKEKVSYHSSRATLYIK